MNRGKTIQFCGVGYSGCMRHTGVSSVSRWRLIIIPVLALSHGERDVSLDGRLRSVVRRQPH